MRRARRQTGRWALAVVWITASLAALAARAETFEEELERLSPNRSSLAVYDAEERRDPFRSLLEGSQEIRERPPGIRGMAIGEITLRGVLTLPAGNKGIFEGTDGKSYLLGVGGLVFDGVVTEVHANEVVFEREIRDVQQRVKEKQPVVVKLHH